MGEVILLNFAVLLEIASLYGWFCWWKNRKNYHDICQRLELSRGALRKSEEAAKANKEFALSMERNWKQSVFKEKQQNALLVQQQAEIAGKDTKITELRAELTAKVLELDQAQKNLLTREAPAKETPVKKASTAAEVRRAAEAVNARTLAEIGDKKTGVPNV